MHDVEHRPQWDSYFAAITHQVASRASCSRRAVGCVLVNYRGQILATGYNGPPRGMSNCTSDQPCPGLAAPPGHGLELCEAVHAEANALLQCRDVYDIYTCYVTCTPCLHCIKLLANTGCKVIVAAESYHPDHDEKVRRFWERQPDRRLNILIGGKEDDSRLRDTPVHSALDKHAAEAEGLAKRE